MTPFNSFLKLVQYSGFLLTEFTNIILLYLIHTRATSKFGSYKYLMQTYAIFSLVFGFVGIVTQPIIQLTGAGYIIYSGSVLSDFKTLGNYITASYYAGFGLCVALLSSHFIFRYCAVCKPYLLPYIEEKLFFAFLIPSIIIFLLWYILALLTGTPTDIKSGHFENDLMLFYGEDSHKVAYFAALYYYTDNNGNLIIRWGDLLNALIVMSTMITLQIIIIICGFKTYAKMGEQSAVSKRTRELNKQLTKTLIIQFLVPLITMFIPIGFLVTLPLFKINVGKLANMMSMNAALYPALDALVAIIMIREFRKAFICRRKPDINSVCDITTLT